MTEQATLFKPGPQTGGLTDHQQRVLDILERHPAGIRAIDVGVTLHQELSKPCPCGPGRACKWAHSDASQILRALRKRDLAIQRRGTGGLWQLMTATSAARSDSRPRSTYDPASADIPF